MTNLWKFAVVAALVAAFGALVAVGLGLPAEEAVPRDYQCEVYTEQGCGKYVVASGGEIEIQSGGEIETLSGAVVDFQGDVGIGGDIVVTGTASWGCSDTAITGTLIVSDTLTAQDLFITDTTTLSGTVHVSDTLSAATSIDANLGMTIDGGVTNIGGGTPGIAAGDNDLYVTGDFEVASTTVLSSTVLVSGTLSAASSIDANAGMTIDGGVTNIGGGTPGIAAGDNDLYVTNDIEVAGTTVLSGTVLVSGTLTSKADLEHMFLPTVVISDVAYTGATGAAGAVATIADGEIWFVWAVFVNVTTDFDCTGDDCTLIVGDGADTDGFVVLADAEMQIADTEQTGSPAGWQGLVAATMGVYLDGAVSSAPHVYAPSGAAETIDFLISEASGDTLAGGEATIYVIYTRIL